MTSCFLWMYTQVPFLTMVCVNTYFHLELQIKPGQAVPVNCNEGLRYCVICTWIKLLTHL